VRGKEVEPALNMDDLSCAERISKGTITMALIDDAHNKGLLKQRWKEETRENKRRPEITTLRRSDRSTKLVTSIGTTANTS
jgi:hypothetical protein